ncbi:MAG TPA: PhzF family phenazine biosynthesis protein [Candidatus Saccharicenans sp.]|nr:PhzF family phenazine biosynthesis protein [Candidatus Saccharicenans sp.]HQM73772.1 PhzF family phenazine biosynthesis protein [Candidatus Saccharicenans sp.]
MKIPFYQVDAFSSRVFGGNPAAVCLLQSWLEDEILQAIAAENNLSETAFLVPKGKSKYALRWFTPAVEVDLCGHATLASAFVILSFVEPAWPSVDFETISGQLPVTRSGELLSMDFPSRKPEPAAAPPLLSQALGETPLEVLSSRDLMAVFKDEETIKEMKPDFEKLKQLKDVFGIIVTARGREYDFVSRYFAPGIGVPEDPVTGSAHCTLVPYWSEKLGKEHLRAYQLSKRGGEIFCHYQGERVKISGQAALYAKGEICL